MSSIRSLMIQRPTSSEVLDFEDDDKFEDDPDGNFPRYATLSYSWGHETEMMGIRELDLDDQNRLPSVLSTEAGNFCKALFEVATAVEKIHFSGGGSKTGQEYYGWHADIRPENILPVKGRFKLDDSGFTKFDKKKAITRLQEERDQNIRELDKGDGIHVCDAGGGTIDINVIKMSSFGGEITHLMPPTYGENGSTRIDKVAHSSSLTKCVEFSRLDGGEKQSSTESSVLDTTPGTILPRKQTEKSLVMYTRDLPETFSSLCIETCCTCNRSSDERATALKTMSYQYRNAAIRGEQSYSESSVFGIIAIVDTVWKQYHQLSSILGLLRKGNKSNFLRSLTRFSNANVLYHLNGVRQRFYRSIPEAPGPLVMNTTNLLIGDGEIGPQAGPPSMGREDDDDDDCVGFHRFSRLNPSSKMVEERAQSHASLNICNLHKQSLCAAIPKYGPPKRDPVAAAISGPVKKSLDASTLSTWRDVISRTCAEGAGLYSTKAKVWQGSSWQNAVVGL